MIKQGLLKNNLFAFSMVKGDDDLAATGSELTLGWINPSRYSGELTWHDVVLPHFWSVKLDRVTLSFSNGPVLVTLCGDNDSRKCMVTPDSGTSSMTFPTWAFHRLENAL